MPFNQLVIFSTIPFFFPIYSCLHFPQLRKCQTSPIPFLRVSTPIAGVFSCLHTFFTCVSNTCMGLLYEWAGTSCLWRSESRPGTGTNPVRERERIPSGNGSECRVVHVSRSRWPVSNRNKRDFKRSIYCTTQGHRSFVALSLRRWFLTTKHTLFFSSWYEFPAAMLSFLLCS